MCSSIIYCITKCRNSSKRKTRIKMGICENKNRGDIMLPYTQLARDSTLYFLFSNGKSNFLPSSKSVIYAYLHINSKN